MLVSFEAVKQCLRQLSIPWIAPALIVLGLLVYFNRQSRSRTARPPGVPYLLPWVGSAIEMGKNPDAFFARASSTLGPVFRVKAVGQDITYVTSPDLISAIYRDSKTFEFTPIRLEISKKIFGMSHEAVYCSFHSDQYLPMHHRALSPKNVRELLQTYTGYARECILKAVDRFDGERTPLIPFLIPPAYSSAALVFFGRSFDAEKSYKPFRSFDDYFHFMVAGMPRFLIPRPHRAWDQVVKMFEMYLQVPHEDCCEFMQLVEVEARHAGWSNRDIARAMAIELWALEANAIQAAYWIIVLGLQNQVLPTIVTEIDDSRMEWKTRYPDKSLDANLHQWLSEAPLPLLTSTIQESLRRSTSTFSIRRVSEPVDFAGYHFEAGERIVCATRAVHLDEEIHPDAHEFIPERYLDSQKKFSKNGRVVPNHTIPFGGGVSMCEGRHFALGELKIYIALILTYANIELDPEWTTRPRYYTERMGVGLMPPAGDLGVKIRKRNVV